MRILSTLAVVVVAMTSVGTASAAPIVFSAIGTSPADIQATVDAFRASLGTLNANTPGSVGSGRREINWDGVPDGFSVEGICLASAGFEAAGDRANLSAALGDQANVLMALGKLAEALASAERGVVIARELGDARNEAAGLGPRQPRRVRTPSAASPRLL